MSISFRNKGNIDYYYVLSFIFLKTMELSFSISTPRSYLIFYVCREVHSVSSFFGCICLNFLLQSQNLAFHKSSKCFLIFSRFMCFSYTLINLRQTPIGVTRSWRSTGSLSVFKIAFPISILLG